MLKQLEGILNQELYRLGGQVLIEQALWLARVGEIKWVHVSDSEVRGEVLLALPGREPVATTVFFFESLSEEAAFYFFSLGDRSGGPSRNSADKDVAELARQIFGEKAEAA